MKENPSLSEQLAERLRYEEGIAQCSRALIAGGPRTLDTALEHLRAAANASRVYLFENFLDPHDGLCMRQTYEACAPGVSPQIGNPVLCKLRYSEDYDEARKLLEVGKPFFATFDDLQPGMRALLEPQGILSILNIPVEVAGDWFGFLGFDDTVSRRRWSAQDVRLLQTGAEMVGAYIGRESAVEELARRQAALDTMFRTIPTGIARVQDRVIMVANERLCGMTGYTMGDLLGRSSRILYQDQEEFDRVGIAQRSGTERGGIRSIETHWVRKDGTGIDVLLSTAPVVAGESRGDYFVAAQDITERADAERQRRAMEGQVQQLQRLESLGVLAGGIAHDFNNLLMVVLGNVELLATEPSLPPSLRSSLADMNRAVRHGADLTRELLAYAGKGKMIVEKLDISTVVQETRAIIAVSLIKRARIEYRLASGLPRVEMDATQLRQVVMNLLTNASEALGPQGGDITVSTGARLMEEPDLVATILGSEAKPGRYVFLEVTDTGLGMDADTQAKIFDPFFSTKFPGRGLGLAAVHGIVRSYHGCMTVKSEVDMGTVFCVMLPVIPA